MFTRLLHWWRQARPLAKIFRYDIQDVMNEIAALRRDTVSEFARLNGELGKLCAEALPAVERLGRELTALHDYAVSEFVRHDGELGKLHAEALPAVERLGREVSTLHDHVVSEFARHDGELGKLQKPEGANLGNEISALHDIADRKIESLRGEQSRLHGLVAGRLMANLQQLNQQIYDLKRSLFHPCVTPEPDAFNGQFSKHQIFCDLCEAFPFDVFVETGANAGSTTRFLARSGKPVYSVEIDRGFYEQAQERLRAETRVHLMLDDSAQFLEKLTAGTLSETDLVFFYLDAHWNGRLPLQQELSIIRAQHAHAVVMIDDFKVEDDVGYGYDSYDGGQEITLAYLHEELRNHGWQVFFPALPSIHDHMLTDILPPRGTAVVAREPKIVSTLRQLQSLRQ